jgi:general secretion pathway protein L
MLIEIVSWWSQQMRDLIPQRLSHRDTLGDALIVRALGGLDVELATRRRGVVAMLARATFDEAGLHAARTHMARVRRPGPVVLILPEPMLLEQEASLPLAAERDLHQVLRHEMDRLTPFRAEDVFWSWRIAGRDAVNGRLQLLLSFVPKAGLRTLLAALDQASLRPAEIEVTAGGGLHRIGIAPPGERSSPRGGARVAAWACGVLAALALIVPVVLQERAIAQINSTIETLEPGVAVVDRLRSRIHANASGADVFAAETARVGNALQAIAAITRMLPDDSYLTQLTLHERRLTLTGRSAEAARLIAALSSDPTLHDPAFAAPVTRTGGDHGDQFTIRAELSR